jgi:hypothetical protein
MLNKRALLKRGWNARLIRLVLDPPDQVERHEHGYRRWTEYLYAEERVACARADARFVEAGIRRAARELAERRRRLEIGMRYGTWQDAAPDAAAALAVLNRYARHPHISLEARAQIHALKADFIELLYRGGYCTAAWIDRRMLERQMCRECGGSGGADWDCEHCGGTGVWREACALEYWRFQFLVAGKTYCWHQSLSSIRFSPAETVPAQPWVEGERANAKRLSRRKFEALKALVQWAVDAEVREE